MHHPSNKNQNSKVSEIGRSQSQIVPWITYGRNERPVFYVKMLPSSSVDSVLWRLKMNPDVLAVGDAMVGELIGGDDAVSEPVEYCRSIYNDNKINKVQNLVLNPKTTKLVKVFSEKSKNTRYVHFYLILLNGNTTVKWIAT